MQATVRRPITRLFLAATVILMLIGVPTVAPVYADCSTGTCSSSN